MKLSPTSDTCQACGACCRNFPYVQVSREDINALEAFTGQAFDCFTYSRDKGEENNVDRRFLQFKENGDCVFLIETNGHFACGVYGSRPALCQVYPSNAIQHSACEDNWTQRLQS